MVVSGRLAIGGLSDLLLSLFDSEVADIFDWLGALLVEGDELFLDYKVTWSHLLSVNSGSVTVVLLLDSNSSLGLGHGALVALDWLFLGWLLDNWGSYLLDSLGEMLNSDGELSDVGSDDLDLSDEDWSLGLWSLFELDSDLGELGLEDGDLLVGGGDLLGEAGEGLNNFWLLWGDNSDNCWLLNWCVWVFDSLDGDSESVDLLDEDWDTSSEDNNSLLDNWSLLYWESWETGDESGDSASDSGDLLLVGYEFSLEGLGDLNDLWAWFLLLNWLWASDLGGDFLDVSDLGVEDGYLVGKSSDSSDNSWSLGGWEGWLLSSESSDNSLDLGDSLVEDSDLSGEFGNTGGLGLVKWSDDDNWGGWGTDDN